MNISNMKIVIVDGTLIYMRDLSGPVSTTVGQMAAHMTLNKCKYMLNHIIWPNRCKTGEKCFFPMNRKELSLFIIM